MKNSERNIKSLTNESRRNFIKHMGLSLGGLAACSLIAGNSISTAMAYTTKSNSADMAGGIFSQPQMNILKHIAEAVLPATDTPSGAEVDCHGFVDHQLKYCHSKVQQQQSIAIVNKIAEYSNKHYQLSYENISSQLRAELLNNIEAEQGFTPEDKKSFKFLKALIVFGFFTTEVGATQALNYQAVPGGFIGSIPYTDKSKAWGSLGFY